MQSSGVLEYVSLSRFLYSFPLCVFHPFFRLRKFTRKTSVLAITVVMPQIF